MLKFPDGYENRFDPAEKDWKRVLFDAGKVAQAAEMNEVQAIMGDQFTRAFNSVFKDGTYLTGGSISTVTDDNTITVNITAGQLWASGFIHDVQADTIDITGIGTEVIGLRLESQVITEDDDPDLLDPIVGAENYGYPGAAREHFLYTFVLNEDGAIPIATFVDGRLVLKNEVNAAWLDQLYAILAQRTYEESGSYVAEQPKLSINDVGASTANPLFLNMDITDGIGYARGTRIPNIGKSNQALKRPLTGQDVLSEPSLYLTGTKKYARSNSPVQAVTRVQAIVQSPTISMTRGGIVNGADSVPGQYTPLESIVSAVQGVTTYVQGTDYSRVGNTIQWLSGGSQPATGSSYNLVVKFTEQFTKGIRTKTSVSNETHSVSGGTFTLSHTKLLQIDKITDAAGTTTYVEGTDYTYNKRTGVVTSVSGNIPNGTNNTKTTYSYWATTTEGNYLARDSFVDSTGVVLYNQTPTYLPSADSPTVDYLTDIVFDNTGDTPVNNTNVLIDYTYGVGRIDVLAWKRTGNNTGLLTLLEGQPGVSAAAPVPNADYLPICKLKMPAEARAADVKIEFYNNLTVPMTEIRTMQTQLHNTMYNMAQLQLVQDTDRISTPTDKLGIFADDFSTVNLADLTHNDFDGTFDLLSRDFSLPRTGETTDKTSSISATHASLKKDIWLTDYTSEALITNPYGSEYALINPYGFVNTRANVTITPNPLISVLDQTISVKSNFADEVTLPTKQLKQARLLQTAASSAWVSAQNGTNTSGENKLLDLITPDPQWVKILNNNNGEATGLVNRNEWDTIIANVQMYVSNLGLPTAQTITISGSKFSANEKAIMCMLDNKLITLTATGGTTQETTSGFTAGVRAKSDGTFTATASVPAGTKTGTYNLQFIGHNSTDMTIKSLSSAALNVGTFIRQTALQVTTNPNWDGGQRAGYIVMGFIELLGIKYDYDAQSASAVEGIINAGYNRAGYVVAYAVAEANRQGITVNHSLVVAALYGMWALCAFLDPKPTTDQLDAIANVMTLSSTNGDALANQVFSLNENTYWYLWRPLYGHIAGQLGYDPLAQTFTMPDDGFVNSVVLDVGTVPTDDSISVLLAEVDNGFPTQRYLARAVKAPAELSSGSNTFTFERPVYLNNGKTYCFVIMTDDPTATVRVGRLGANDLTNGLITKNPYSGAMFRSPNAQSWELDPTADVKFTLNRCKFTYNQSILSLGTHDFGSGATHRSIVVLDVPFVCPTNDTNVTYQYSVDAGQSWKDFLPKKELDLAGDYEDITLRVLLNGTSKVSPFCMNAASLDTFIYNSSGAYVHRSYDAPTFQVVDVWVEVDIPGSTTLAFSVDFGSGFQAMSEVTDDATSIDGTWYQRHYTYDANADKTHTRTKCTMTSSVDYVTPRIRKYRVINT